MNYEQVDTLKKRNFHIINNNQKNMRNYGIDLARIISMFYIVSSHIIYQGGPLFHVKKLSFEHKGHLLLKIIYSSGVNIFGMISGFVGLYSHKYSNLFYHLITTIFYNFLIAKLFKIFRPKLINNIIIYLNPIFNSNYWYINEYFKMFFFIKLINRGVISMNFQSMKNFVIILYFIFSIIGIIKNFYKKLLFRDIFSLKLGFSYNWLLILYCYGSYLGKFKKINKFNSYYKYLFMYAFCIVIKYILNVYTINIKKIGKVFNIIDFTTPFEVLMSISFIMILSNINFKKNLNIKFISFFGPLTFGIYLIHGHFLVMRYLIKNHFLWILKYKNFFIIFLLEILCSFGIFLFCSLIDFIREQIFKLIKLKKLCIIIEYFIEKTSEKVCIFDLI